MSRIGALLTSIDEPQLQRCLTSIGSQAVPFSDFVHINNVVPASAALNLGISKVSSEWFMYIGGDFILHQNAVEVAHGYIDHEGNDQICGYCFGIYDTFLQCTTGYCNVYRTIVFKLELARDTLYDDRQLSGRLRRKGWKFRKPKEVLATHFDDPSEFQVFCRFFFHANKFNDDNSYVRDRMNELLKDTGNPLYQVGLDALNFAKLKHNYPGSPNLDFNKKMFEEFKRRD